jgi:hypothetical protein
LFAELPLEPIEQAVVSGWIAWGAQNWEALRELEATFAAVPREHPLAGQAERLRAEWRVASQVPALGAEAVVIIDRAHLISNWPDQTLFRAQACVLAGYKLAALTSLSKINPRFLADRKVSQQFSRLAREVLRKVPRDPELEVLRNRIDRLLGE